jgi:hypothetical protein
MTKITELNASFLGLRFDDNKYKIGNVIPCSHDWDYENDIRSEELLDGTCAVGIWNIEEESEVIEKAQEHVGDYAEDYIYLVTGESYEYGADDGEIIITECRVIGVIEL